MHVRPHSYSRYVCVLGTLYSSALTYRAGASVGDARVGPKHRHRLGKAAMLQLGRYFQVFGDRRSVGSLHSIPINMVISSATGSCLLPRERRTRQVISVTRGCHGTQHTAGRTPNQYISWGIVSETLRNSAFASYPT